MRFHVFLQKLNLFSLVSTNSIKGLRTLNNKGLKKNIISYYTSRKLNYKIQ